MKKQAFFLRVWLSGRQHKTDAPLDMPFQHIRCMRRGENPYRDTSLTFSQFWSGMSLKERTILGYLRYMLMYAGEWEKVRERDGYEMRVQMLITKRKECQRATLICRRQCKYLLNHVVWVSRKMLSCTAVMYTLSNVMHSLSLRV